jgi:hypothetical protein
MDIFKKNHPGVTSPNRCITAPLLFLLSFLLLTVTSCGDFYELTEKEEVNLGSIKIARDNVSLMAGEYFIMQAKASVPDSLLGGLYWESSDNSVLRVSGDTVFALQPGKTKVKVVSVKRQLKDSITVTVVERWQMSPYQYARDMVVYADVTVKGQKADDNLIIGAFVDDELRGVGELKQASGRQYVQIRIYSPETFGEDAPDNYKPSDPKATDSDEVDDSDDEAEDEDPYEAVTFRCYDRKQAQFFDFPVTLYFDGKTHGTLSNLYKLTIE